MFNLAEKYKVNQKIATKTFIQKDFKVEEKRKLKEILRNITLSYQITGEEISSVVSEEYNCQVIMFLDIEIDNIKNATFVSNIIQQQLKPYAVLNVYDKNMQRYFFAEKRLNQQDKNEVVIVNTVSTKESSLYFYERVRKELEERLDIDNIISKQSKLAFYREMMVKAFIITEEHLVSNKKTLLESNIWYNERKVQEVLESLKNLEKYKLQAKSIKETNERVMVNKEIKEINEKLKELI